MDHSTIIFVLAILFGLLMACGIGANDVANAMGTSVGAKVFTLRQAILVAMVFEFLGAFLAGGEVTSTISKGITDPHYFYSQPDIFVYGMLSSLLASGIWLIVASYCGWPVSTTHSLIGSIVGFAILTIGPGAVYWPTMFNIILSWIISPVIGCVVSYCVFTSIQNLIIRTDTPFINAKRYIPFYVFAMGCGISLITLVKGLKHIGLHLSILQGLAISVGFGSLLFAISKLALSRIVADPNLDKDFHFTNVERIFGIMMMFTACSMAFAHGSNDVSNAIGPLAAIVDVLENPANIGRHTVVQSWILVLGGLGIVIGLATYGYKVIETIGKNITELTPSRGFSAEISAAFIVVCASGLGLPVSTTHTLVGAILGVGFARGIGALNTRVLQKIFMSWIITLPVGALLTMGVFVVIRAIFA